LLARGNPSHAESSWTNPSGYSSVVYTNRAFDTYGNVTQVIFPFESGEPGPIFGYTTIQYDAASATFPVQVKVGSQLSPAFDLVSTIEYELPGCGAPVGMGLPCRLVDPNTQPETRKYDGFGRLIATAGPNGAATATLYHDEARGTVDQRTETRARWSSTGPSDPSQDGTAAIEVSFYDGLFRPLEEQRSGLGPNVARRMIFYAPAGSVAAISRWDFGVDPVGSTLLHYDAIGRLTSATSPDGTVEAYSYGPRLVTSTTTIPVDGLVHKTISSVDAFGQLAEVQEFASPTGPPARTLYLHDAFGQLVQVVDAVGASTSGCLSDQACTRKHVTRIFYDQLGNRIRLEDPDSGTWIALFDARGHVVQTQDPRQKIQMFQYDELGRIKRRSASVSGPTEGDDIYSYGLVGTTVPNGLGRLVRIDDHEGSDSFTYDAAGNVALHRRELLGLRFDFTRTYDPLGRIAQTTYPDLETVTWHYDKRLLKRISPTNGAYAGDYVSSLTYDALDRPGNLELGGSAGAPLAKELREYDSLTGRLKRMKGFVNWQSVADFQYVVDGAGRVRSQAGSSVSAVGGVPQGASMDYRYDGLDRLVEIPSLDYDYDYDVLGSITKKDQQAGYDLGWASLEYTHPNRPHALTHASAPSGTRTIDYEYDDAGNVTRKSRTGYQGVPGAGASTVDFTYDSQGRLRSASATDLGTTTFTYAAGGRQLTTQRLNMTVAMPEPGYEYHSFHHRVNKHFFVGSTRVASSARSWTATPVSVPAWFSWRGPDLEAPPPWAFGVTYGMLAMLLLGVAIRRRDEIAIVRALGLRVGSAGTLLLVAPALLASPCGVGPPPNSFGLGTHDEPALFYLSDHLGSTILTVEEGGTIRNRYYYMPFGDPGVADQGPSLRHRFTGAEIVEGTGLYQLGARVYDPETGRFLQPDPIVPAPSNPQCFNRFSYVLNSPLNFIDPTGYGPRNEEGGSPRPNNPPPSPHFTAPVHGPGHLNIIPVTPPDPNSQAYRDLQAFIEAWEREKAAERAAQISAGYSSIVPSRWDEARPVSSNSEFDPVLHGYHTLEEIAVAQLVLWTGIAVTGVSLYATGLLFIALPATGGLSGILIPYTLVSASGGAYLTLTGINANIDIINWAVNSNVPNLNSLLSSMSGGPPFAVFPAFSKGSH
jgi:RHS repeat-associated protein